jgi:peptidoglycan-N-acetylglucosamine deacetylase
LRLALQERIGDLRQGLQKRADNVIKAWIGPISHVSTDQPVAALTFDDGPDPRFTPALLDILEKHRAKATFFVLGKVAQKYPEIVRAAAEHGHAIGNHSWDHPSFPLIAGSERRRQLRACASALAPHGSALFRPPFGHQSLPMCLDAARLGYQIVKWNMHGYDWLDHDGRWMAEHMIEQIRPGSIITLHDALYRVLDPCYADRTPTLDAVDLLLTRLHGKYQFLTVPDLLSYGVPQRQSCFWKADLEFLRKLENSERARESYASKN